MWSYSQFYLLPVKHLGSQRVVQTYVFYGNGSTGYFLTEQLRAAVNAPSNETALSVKAMHGKSITNSSFVNNLMVADINRQNEIELPKPFIEREQIPDPEVLKKCTLYKDNADKIPRYDPNLKVGLLIGRNCPQALRQLKVIPTTRDGPDLQHYITMDGR